MSVAGMPNGARITALLLENSSPNIWLDGSHFSYRSSSPHYFRHGFRLFLVDWAGWEGAGLEAGT